MEVGVYLRQTEDATATYAAQESMIAVFACRAGGWIEALGNELIPNINRVALRSDFVRRIGYPRSTLISKRV
jgi:hypothetical protein